MVEIRQDHIDLMLFPGANPTRVSPQMTSQSTQLFFSHYIPVTNTQTDTQTTLHATSVSITRIWCSLKINVYLVIATVSVTYSIYLSTWLVHNLCYPLS